MMRYVVIYPCNGYVYKGNGFLVLLGYGEYLGAGAGIGNEAYLMIQSPSGNNVHVCYFQAVWTDGSALTSNANLNSGTAFNRGVMVNGQKLNSSSSSGADSCVAIECDTLEEAAQLL